MQKIQSNGTMYQQLMMMSQQLMQLSTIVAADHPELQGGLMNQMGQAQSATSQGQPIRGKMSQPSESEQRREQASNQASPV